jgi:hypothetical protein
MDQILNQLGVLTFTFPTPPPLDGGSFYNLKCHGEIKEK